MFDGSAHLMRPNRLASEKSPYLLQHAHNPVDWFPWGREAFEKAALENKPIFLSIGYSTCHWCHVMERESFENDQIARLLNDNFLPIKVDREERPDIDRVYMLFVQAATGSGGWPLSVFLTPDLQPFFGGTYFPPDDRWGRPGFRSLLLNLARAWREDRAHIEQTGANAVDQLRNYTKVTDEGSVSAAGKEALEDGFSAFRRMFDSKHGGFGGAPKFPRPSAHSFLLRYYAESGNREALEMVIATLREMRKGGMNDQLGGGFHRYSVDERWFVPHFEKMLYDQAQLATSYIEAFQITHDPEYASSAHEIFSYVLRDLAHPDGGFYSAEDADSAVDFAHPDEKHEGAFYLWTAKEVDAALPPGDATIVRYRFGIEDQGNVEEDPQAEFAGRNILWQAHTIEETAQHAGLSVDRIRDSLEAASAKLLEIRNARPRPHLDDKILCGWNGLMISALAKGGQAFDDPRYAEAARRAVDFIRREMWNPSRRVLLRRYREGAAIDAFLDDYAFLILGLIDLYETQFNPDDLAFAVDLAERALELFEDRENGGFFSAAAESADLVLRLKDDYDGAEPSGNSAMALALLRLARMKDRGDFEHAAERIFRAFGTRLKAAPAGLPFMLAALSVALGRRTEIVLSGQRSREFEEMLGVIRRRFLPGAIVVRSEDAARPMSAGSGAAAFVCENYACKLPVYNSNELEEQLEQRVQ